MFFVTKIIICYFLFSIQKTEAYQNKKQIPSINLKNNPSLSSSSSLTESPRKAVLKIKIDNLLEEIKIAILQVKKLKKRDSTIQYGKPFCERISLIRKNAWRISEYILKNNNNFL